MATHTPDEIKGNIDPLLLGRAVKMPDALACKEPVKGASINKIIVEIVILHMNNHFISP
jgi:hypothetical protein